LKKIKTNILSGVILMVVGSFIGKTTYLVRIYDIGITLSNLIVALGIIIVTFNIILLTKNKTEFDMVG